MVDLKECTCKNDINGSWCYYASYTYLQPFLEHKALG